MISLATAKKMPYKKINSYIVANNKKMIRRAIYNKNSLSKKAINEILYNERALIVSKFKESLILDDGSEFFKRLYERRELNEKLKKIFNFYDSYSQIYPNYISLRESKFIYQNIKRKQRMIDNLHMIEKEFKKNKESKINNFHVFNSETVKIIEENQANTKNTLNQNSTLINLIENLKFKGDVKSNKNYLEEDPSFLNESINNNRDDDFKKFDNFINKKKVNLNENNQALKKFVLKKEVNRPLLTTRDTNPKILKLENLKNNPRKNQFSKIIFTSQSKENPDTLTSQTKLSDKALNEIKSIQQNSIPRQNKYISHKVALSMPKINDQLVFNNIHITNNFHNVKANDAKEILGSMNELIMKNKNLMVFHDATPLKTNSGSKIESLNEDRIENSLSDRIGMNIQRKHNPYDQKYSKSINQLKKNANNFKTKSTIPQAFQSGLKNSVEKKLSFNQIYTNSLKNCLNFNNLLNSNNSLESSESKDKYHLPQKSKIPKKNLKSKETESLKDLRLINGNIVVNMNEINIKEVLKKFNNNKKIKKISKI